MDRRIAERLWRFAILASAAFSLVACASAPPPRSITTSAGQKIGRPYEVKGVWYTPKAQPNYDEVGAASWYGPQHQGRPTANGERFDMNAVSAAHKTLPLPSLVEVTNLDNGKRIRVRVNDRGPFVSGRIIDLSLEAAKELGFASKGLARVRVRYVGPGNDQRASLAEARVDEAF